MRFESIAVVGIGLVGGSIAAAAKKLPHAPRVVGVDVDVTSLHRAIDLGYLDEASLPDGLGAQTWLGPDGVDLVVLATPAARVSEWLDTLGTWGYCGVVTDVASTKSAIIAAAACSLGDDATFVGGHPMAGSERSGIDAARSDLFKGAYYVLTPTADTDMDAYRRLHAFITEIGARVVSVDAELHDEAVAIVSHVPHVAAAALVELAAAHAGESRQLLRLAAGGFKDTTRIAAGSPELWTGICLDNAPALVAGLRELSSVLDDFAGRLERNDAHAVREWLDSAASVRRSLPAQWVPESTRLTELLVPVLDRTGVVSEVTGAASSAGCNIEAIEIDHVTEDSAVLVLVLTDEGDIDRLVSDLESIGYAPTVRALDDEAGEIE